MTQKSNKTIITFKDGGKIEHISKDISSILIESELGETIKIENQMISVIKKNKASIETIPISFTPKKRGADEEK